MNLNDLGRWVSRLVKARAVHRADMRLWRDATTLDDLARLTAHWLEGSITSQPGYMPGYGPDDETLPLIPTLAGVNRAGWLTDCSQPGWGPEVGYDGETWSQRAAVTGFTTPDLAERIRQAATTAGLLVVAYSAPGKHRRSWSGIPVTTRAGRPYTAFGGHRSHQSIEFQYQGCGDQAIDAVLAATHLTVIDPEWGREDRLWPLLADMLDIQPEDDQLEHDHQHHG